MIRIPQKEKIQTKLLRWFEKNGRDLPWRKTQDPYAIWVSEIMLQQTQVVTVIPYYQRFLRAFPTISRLARADLLQVLKTWEGLGYYSRARNLHQASQIVLKDFHGKVPDTLNALLSLPGIGRSTAGAILSFAHNKEAAILDGNAKRVLSRLFAVSGNPMRGKIEAFLWHISESLIPEGESNPFNQALMDLGSMICIPRDPLCSRCPLRYLCKGYLSGRPESYPPQTIKRRIPHITAVSAVIQMDGKVLLNRRPPKGLLGGLWEFPNWKSEDKKGLRLGLRLRNYVKKNIGMNVRVKESLGTFRQTFSHFKLTLHVFQCEALDRGAKEKWVPIQNLHLFPMSRMHRRIAEIIAKKSNEIS
ncbi:MAG: A/G-specific adenine glycosylase [Thermodesulfobacteriota bacterium]|jgi:A/G-specific adenine glycosylase